jgi:hypothetical protein
MSLGVVAGRAHVVLCGPLGPLLEPGARPHRGGGGGFSRALAVCKPPPKNTTTSPADARSTKKFGLHQPRPSPGPPSSVTSCSTTATTPRPLAHHAFDDLHDQDSVVGSDGFDGTNDEGGSDCLDY